MTRFRGPQPLINPYFCVDLDHEARCEGVEPRPHPGQCLVAMTFYITHNSVKVIISGEKWREDLTDISCQSMLNDFRNLTPRLLALVSLAVYAVRRPRPPKGFGSSFETIKRQIILKRNILVPQRGATPR